MRRCFRLASAGLGYVRPNPMVGCVIVRDGEVIAEGFHRRHGAYHAERDAIMRLTGGTDPQPGLLRGATLYVNLEPCAHHGLTPPCADLLVRCGVSRVVCCNDDPNPLVAGRGFARLEAAGIEVVRHTLEEEGRHLNRRFFTFMERQRPYVILKWAASADGYMAPPPATDGSRYWLSSPHQTLLSHQWRTQEAAILVGSQTYIDDSPSLTARLFHGNDPIPVVLDRRERLDDLPPRWLHLLSATPTEAMHELYTRNIQSVIVEGGRQILDAFLAEGLYDEVRVFRTAKPLGGGLPAPTPPPTATYW